MREEIPRVLREAAEHPAAEQGEDEHDGRDLGHEGEGLLLDGSRRLEYRDDEADDHRDEEDGRRQE